MLNKDFNGGLHTEMNRSARGVWVEVTSKLIHDLGPILLNKRLALGNVHVRDVRAELRKCRNEFIAVLHHKLLGFTHNL